MRKLATLRRVSGITPIDGADMIELAQVDGWQCVVKKGEFLPGELGVYFEIDSFLPVEERYEFLRKSSYKNNEAGEGFRLRTTRLRGALSQGLLMPVSVFPEIVNLECGEDVTELLGIRLYEPPVPAQLQGMVRGSFPSVIRKTDQERIQNLPEYLVDLRGIAFEVTEKLDGSSMTVYVNDGQFGVCSRNFDLKETEDNSFWQMARILDIEHALGRLGRNLALQGELVGPGIQKNPLKLRDPMFFLFDIWNIDTQCYLTPRERMALLSSLPETIRQVPVVDPCLKVFDVFPTMEEILVYAQGRSQLCMECEREGLVFKSLELVGHDIVSFKAINNVYLLKQAA